MTEHHPIDDTLTLTDGRVLSYSKWGSADATPLFYFHGFPSSHHELELTLAALRRNEVPVRVITLNRPGFGTSTFQEGRSLLDWPADVVEAADHFGINRFAVLGVSAGGPYALACGHAIPHRVTKVGIIAGIAPLTAPGMSEAPIAKTAKSRWVRRLQFAMMAYALNNGKEDKFVEQALAVMGEADRQTLTEPKTLEQFLGMTRGALAQGGKAAAHEAGLYLQSWGFDPADITVPTHLWYGGLDKMAPATAGRWLAERIPESTYTYWPQHGHLTWCTSDEAAETFAVTTTNAPPTTPS